MEKYIFFYETTGCLHPAKISTLEAEEESRQLACKPGSVWPRFDPERGSHSSGTAFACRLAQPTRMTGPETGCERAFARPVSSLFGLAPGGVYLAAAVTRSAVGSYPTLSPLPCGCMAVCSLWHFPWGRPRRTLSGTVCRWSPDFPPPQPFDHSGSGRPAG